MFSAFRSFFNVGFDADHWFDPGFLAASRKIDIAVKATAGAPSSFARSTNACTLIAESLLDSMVWLCSNPYFTLERSILTSCSLSFVGSLTVWIPLRAGQPEKSQKKRPSIWKVSVSLGQAFKTSLAYSRICCSLARPRKIPRFANSPFDCNNF